MFLSLAQKSISAVVFFVLSSDGIKGDSTLCWICSDDRHVCRALVLRQLTTLMSFEIL